MLDQHVNKNESNKVDQDNKQDKETKYLKDDQNNNNIIDKNKNGLDQDHNKSQASIVDNMMIHTMTKYGSYSMQRNQIQRNQISQIHLLP